MKSPKIRAVVGRSRLELALILGAALVPLVVLAVSAQAEILPSETPTSALDSPAPIKTHTNAGVPGVTAPFSIPCDGCHVPHKADSMKLLQADGAAAICATCHDLSRIHGDSATQQSVSASSVPGDCLTCHPHSSGFMPVSGAVSLTLNAQALGYDDLDADGNLSPGDRVHYRIDYENPGPEDVTGVLLRDELDRAHVASVEAITGGGTFDGTAFHIQWDIGALAAGASGSVTYDVVLQDALSFGGSATTSATTAPPRTESPASTQSLAATLALTAADHSGDDSESDNDRSGHDSESDNDRSGHDSESDDDHSGDDSESDDDHSGDDSGSDNDADSGAGSTDVVNTAVLTADNRGPVSASVVVSVVVAGSGSTTSTVSPRRWGPTSTTSTTIVARPTDVVNTVVMTRDDREPVSASVVVSVVVAGPPPTDSPATSTTEGSGTVSDSSVPTQGEQAVEHDDRDDDGSISPGDHSYHPIDGNHGAEDVTLSKRAVGYYDLDDDGELTPGDRVRYRVDYRNLEGEDVTGTLLVDELDRDHVASVEAITGGGTFDGTAIRWNIGTMAAGTSGSVTYDVVLQDASAFGGSATTSTTTAPPTTESPASTESLTTTTTTTTESPTTTTATTTTTTTTESPTTTTTTTESSTTTLPATAELMKTGAPGAAGLAVLSLAGMANRRFFARKKARRCCGRPPRRHS